MEKSGLQNKIQSKIPEIWSAWKLVTDHGRQIWEFTFPDDLEENEKEDFLKEMDKAFIFDKTKNANSSDLVYRSQVMGRNIVVPNQIPFPENSDRADPLVRDAFEGAFNGINFYSSLQMEDGHWPGDYGGPLFLLPGLVIASYVTDSPFPAEKRILIRRYMLNHQNPDGGWGLHIEGKSTMFGTAMQYTALRILGCTPDEPQLSQARDWILKHGGLTKIPSWGKFYMAVLGVFEWKGCNSLFPEMWKFPKWLPVHAWRYWCHCRMVYLPMSYCYGHKVKGKISPLVKQLREEMHIREYSEIDWAKARNEVADEDLFTSPSNVSKAMNRILNFYEPVHSKKLRKSALDFILEYVEAEDSQTDSIDIGPVNQVINSICIWHAYGKEHPKFQKHLERWNDYLWLAEDGMKMNGYNGSQFWDTAFAVQAILEGGMEKWFSRSIKSAYNYIDISQVREDVKDRERFFRHESKGGWPFSTLDHGWPITDCTAEGIKCVLDIHASGKMPDFNPSIEPKRIQEAVDLLLTFQNKNGGWATYELTRAGKWLELLNPSEIYRDIMVDYSWTECSSACLQALFAYRNMNPEYKKNEIENAIKAAIDFILLQQREDGSWAGSWAVCFTYGTWFGVEALKKAKDSGLFETDNRISAALQKAVGFLLSKQKEDGGWGESFESCVRQEYIQHAESQVVNTAWALLSLMSAGSENNREIDSGIELLLKKQEGNGDWAQGAISGVFNQNCMITYTAYRNIFPIWALNRFVRRRLKSI